MPFGALSEFANVVFPIIRKRPVASVLDIGIGFGIYGAAVRQWIDHGVHPFKTVIHGIEGFEQYRNPNWLNYSDVFVMDANEFVAPIKYDVIIMTDVIEHFEKESGHAFIERAKTWLNDGGIFIVSTPAVWMDQGAAHGNEFECHRSLWTPDDMTEHDFRIINDGSLCAWRCQMLTAIFTEKT